MSKIDISNVRSTIIPKSDQLNYEDFISGSMTIRICDVRPGTDEQPLVLCWDGDNGHPYKPNKTFRKVLAHGWGEDARQWIGKSLTLYGDPSVKWAGVEVGGVAVSHMSHIPNDIEIALSATRGKRVKHRVKVLHVQDEPQAPTLQQVLDAIKAATNKPTMEHAKEMAMQLVDDEDVLKAQDAYAARVAELKAPATT